MEREQEIKRIEELAREQHHKDGEIEVDPLTEADLSEGDDNGCYVRVWAWVDFAGTELDKEPEEILEEAERT